MVKAIECPHNDGVLYIYEVSEGLEIHLCEKCNRNLSGEIMKELAKKTFSKVDDE